MSGAKKPVQYVRRRAFNKIHVTSWLIYLEKDGFVRCSFQNCNFMAFDVEEMCNHYGYCKGDNSFAKFICKFCNGRTVSLRKLHTHLVRAHNVSAPEAVASELEAKNLKPADNGRPSRVMVVSWQYFFEKHNYIKCTICSYVANTVSEMCRHYPVCNQEKEMLLYVCPVCKGRTMNVNPLLWHLERSHKLFKTPSQFNHISQSMIRFWEREISENKYASCLHIFKGQRDCSYFDLDILGIIEHSQRCKGPKFVTSKEQCPHCPKWTNCETKLAHHIATKHPQGLEDDIKMIVPVTATRSTVANSDGKLIHHTVTKPSQTPEADLKKMVPVTATISTLANCDAKLSHHIATKHPQGQEADLKMMVPLSTTTSTLTNCDAKLSHLTATKYSQRLEADLKKMAPVMVTTSNMANCDAKLSHHTATKHSKELEADLKMIVPVKATASTVANCDAQLSHQTATKHPQRLETDVKLMLPVTAIKSTVADSDAKLTHHIATKHSQGLEADLKKMIPVTATTSTVANCDAQLNHQTATKHPQRLEADLKMMVPVTAIKSTVADSDAKLTHHIATKFPQGMEADLKKRVPVTATMSTVVVKYSDTIKHNSTMLASEDMAQALTKKSNDVVSDLNLKPQEEVVITEIDRFSTTLDMEVASINSEEEEEMEQDSEIKIADVTSENVGYVTDKVVKQVQNKSKLSCIDGNGVLISPSTNHLKVEAYLQKDKKEIPMKNKDKHKVSDDQERSIVKEDKIMVIDLEEDKQGKEENQMETIDLTHSPIKIIREEKSDKLNIIRNLGRKEDSKKGCHSTLNFGALPSTSSVPGDYVLYLQDHLKDKEPQFVAVDFSENDIIKEEEIESFEVNVVGEDFGEKESLNGKLQVVVMNLNEKVEKESKIGKVDRRKPRKEALKPSCYGLFKDEPSSDDDDDDPFVQEYIHWEEKVDDKTKLSSSCEQPKQAYGKIVPKNYLKRPGSSKLAGFPPKKRPSTFIDHEGTCVGTGNYLEDPDTTSKKKSYLKKEVSISCENILDMDAQENTEDKQPKLEFHPPVDNNVKEDNELPKEISKSSEKNDKLMPNVAAKAMGEELTKSSYGDNLEKNKSYSFQSGSIEVVGIQFNIVQNKHNTDLIRSNQDTLLHLGESRSDGDPRDSDFLNTILITSTPNSKNQQLDMEALVKGNKHCSVIAEAQSNKKDSSHSVQDSNSKNLFCGEQSYSKGQNTANLIKGHSDCLIIPEKGHMHEEIKQVQINYFNKPNTVEVGFSDNESTISDPKKADVQKIALKETTVFNEEISPINLSKSATIKDSSAGFATAAHVTSASKTYTSVTNDTFKNIAHEKIHFDTTKNDFEQHLNVEHGDVKDPILRMVNDDCKSDESETTDHEDNANFIRKPNLVSFFYHGKLNRQLFANCEPLTSNQEKVTENIISSHVRDFDQSNTFNPESYMCGSSKNSESTGKNCNLTNHQNFNSSNVSEVGNTFLENKNTTLTRMQNNTLHTKDETVETISDISKHINSDGCDESCEDEDFLGTDEELDMKDQLFNGFQELSGNTLSLSKRFHQFITRLSESENEDWYVNAGNLSMDVRKEEHFLSDCHSSKLNHHYYRETPNECDIKQNVIYRSELRDWPQDLKQECKDVLKEFPLDLSKNSDFMNKNNKDIVSNKLVNGSLSESQHFSYSQDSARGSIDKQIVLSKYEQFSNSTINTEPIVITSHSRNVRSDNDSSLFTGSNCQTEVVNPNLTNDNILGFPEQSCSDKTKCMVVTSSAKRKKGRPPQKVHSTNRNNPKDEVEISKLNEKEKDASFLTIKQNGTNPFSIVTVENKVNDNKERSLDVDKPINSSKITNNTNPVAISKRWDEEISNDIYNKVLKYLNENECGPNCACNGSVNDKEHGDNAKLQRVEMFEADRLNFDTPLGDESDDNFKTNQTLESSKLNCMPASGIIETVVTESKLGGLQYFGKNKELQKTHITDLKECKTDCSLARSQDISNLEFDRFQSKSPIQDAESIHSDQNDDMVTSDNEFLSCIRKKVDLLDKNITELLEDNQISDSIYLSQTNVHKNNVEAVDIPNLVLPEKKGCKEMFNIIKNEDSHNKQSVTNEITSGRNERADPSSSTPKKRGRKQKLKFDNNISIVEENESFGNNVPLIESKPLLLNKRGRKTNTTTSDECNTSNKNFKTNKERLIESEFDESVLMKEISLIEAKYSNIDFSSSINLNQRINQVDSLQSDNNINKVYNHTSISCLPKRMGNPPKSNRILYENMVSKGNEEVHQSFKKELYDVCGSVGPLLPNNIESSPMAQENKSEIVTFNCTNKTDITLQTDSDNVMEDNEVKETPRKRGRPPKLKNSSFISEHNDVERMIGNKSTNKIDFDKKSSSLFPKKRGRPPKSKLNSSVSSICDLDQTDNVPLIERLELCNKNLRNKLKKHGCKPKINQDDSENQPLSDTGNESDVIGSTIGSYLGRDTGICIPKKRGRKSKQFIEFISNRDCGVINNNHVESPPKKRGRRPKAIPNEIDVATSDGKLSSNSTINEQYGDKIRDANSCSNQLLGTDIIFINKEKLNNDMVLKCKRGRKPTSNSDRYGHYEKNISKVIKSESSFKNMSEIPNVSEIASNKLDAEYFALKAGSSIELDSSHNDKVNVNSDNNMLEMKPYRSKQQRKKKRILLDEYSYDDNFSDAPSDEEPICKPKSVSSRLKAVVVQKPYTPAEDLFFSSKHDVDDKVVCGVCKEEMIYEIYKANHAIFKHYMLCWLDGEEKPIDMGDAKDIVNRLWFAKKRLRKTPFRCFNCNMPKLSAVGFQSHIRFCGKENKEKESLLITCELCEVRLMPSSVRPHMYTQHNTTILTKTMLDKSVIIPKSKRAAANRAVEVIQSQNEGNEEEEEDLSRSASPESKHFLSHMYLKPVKSIPQEEYNRWKKSLKEKNIVTCAYTGCGFSAESTTTFRKHYLTCPIAPPRLYKCRYCEFSSEVELPVQDHVMDRHEDLLHNQVSSEGELSTGSDKESKTSKQLQIKNPVTYNTTNVPLKFLRTAPLTRVRGSPRKYFFTDALTWTWKLRKKNLTRDVMFSEAEASNSSWQPLAPDLLTEYLPGTQTSVKFLVNNDTWHTLRRFEGTLLDGVPVIFAGGPVWATAWASVPDSELQQYLAVATHPNMDITHEMASAYNYKSLIQIWAFGYLSNMNPDSGTTPKFLMGIAHSRGAVWSLRWCPSGCYQESRLGLLAAACSDGSVAIYSIPRYRYSFEYTIYGVEPVMELKLGRKGQPQCTCIDWHSVAPHSLIVGGFANGMVALWDLNNTSALLKEDTSLLPFKVIEAHLSSVSAVSLSPTLEDIYLMTASLDRATKFWLLDDTTVPVNTLRKASVIDAVMPSNWLISINAYDDVFSINSSHITGYNYREAFSLNNTNYLLQSGTVWSVSFNDWLNACACASEMGKVSLFIRQQILVPEDSKKVKKDSLIGDIMTCSVHPLNSWSNSEQFGQSYSECVSNIGLEISFQENITEQKNPKPACSSDTMDSYPILSVNKVTWNPNFQSFSWLAVGLQCGLVMTPRIKCLPTKELAELQLLKDER